MLLYDNNILYIVLLDVCCSVDLSVDR